jgi:hypothetical protein
MTTLRYTNDFGNGHSGFVDYGSGITVITISGQPLNIQTASGNAVQIQPAGVAGDAFGRFRVSNPFTLFDSSHRYQDNDQWSTAVAVSGTATFNANQGLMDLEVTTASGSEVVRESTLVSSYQPGKSLLVMTTFSMDDAKTNLRQRVGYYGAANGIFLELENAVLSFVKRSSITGSVVETKVAQANWNVDKLDGTGPSGITLDITKAQILFSDIEWLGVGTVRLGFVIDGQLIHCHSFHHANTVEATYITTASLPLRYEIKNTDTTASASVLKQICSTVISEGGYELRGQQRSIGLGATAARDLTASGVGYPVVGIRLKSTRIDAVVIPVAVSLIGVGNNAIFKWQLQQGGTISGGTWTSVASGSPVEYNLSGVSSSGGIALTAGYIAADNQGAAIPVNLDKSNLFKYQLRRNGTTSAPEEFTLIVETNANGNDVYSAMSWEEVSS